MDDDIDIDSRADMECLLSTLDIERQNEKRQMMRS